MWAKLCAGILEEVVKATLWFLLWSRILWSKLSNRRHSGYYCGAGHSRRRLVSIVAWITPYATPWVDTYHRFKAENDQDLLFRREHNASRFSSILYCGSQESGVRDSSTSPNNGPVEEVRGRRGLRQTSWEAQLPVDHADPTDRRIFVVSLDKIIWWRRSEIQ
ncbi:hypothetical protein PV328_001057 [Microctonus aethiopoides]|uniref:Uncharacterized protein n=1 Tax=Microctonus aethiopoides TaxID=144406 RepID=A0AA39FXC9_9HYME|nr:hypothetical protein PV328_001057 [Microctonus aethiopoides]